MTIREIETQLEFLISNCKILRIKNLLCQDDKDGSLTFEYPCCMYFCVDLNCSVCNYQDPEFDPRPQLSVSLPFGAILRPSKQAWALKQVCSVK